MGSRHENPKQGNVRPVLEYGMATWGNAAKSNLDRLTKVQNQATRIMTGAIKSTPVKDLVLQEVSPCVIGEI